MGIREADDDDDMQPRRSLKALHREKNPSPPTPRGVETKRAPQARPMGGDSLRSSKPSSTTTALEIPRSELKVPMSPQTRNRYNQNNKEDIKMARKRRSSADRVSEALNQPIRLLVLILGLSMQQLKGML